MGVVVGIAAALALAAASAPTPLKVISEGPAVQERATQVIVHSQAVGRDFLVEVTPPFTPPVLPGQKTSVVLALDSGYGIAGPAGWLLGGAGATQPAYIVTVGYPSGAPNTRERDLLFGPGVRPNGTVAKGGGAQAFTTFLLDELLPYLEKRYPIDRRQTVLVGHSLSGIYAASILAHRPDAFGGYLIASPSLWADPRVAEDLAAMAQKGPPRRVFVAYGAAEAPHMVDAGEKIAAALGVPGSKIELKRRAFEGETHISYYPALLNAALPFLLPRAAPVRHPDPVKLTAAELARYEGVFRLSDGRRLVVSRTGDTLKAKLGELPDQILLAESSGRFFIDGVDAKLTFEGAPSAPAQALVLYVNGAETRAPREN